MKVCFSNNLHKVSRGKVSRFLSGFARDENGSHTIEAVIWFPAFAMVLALVINLTMVFFNKSQMLRVVQDGNRAFSLGRLTSEEEVSDYISENLEHTNADLTIAVTIDGGTISTMLHAPATDLMPMNFLRGRFDNITVGFVAQHIIEF